MNDSAGHPRRNKYIPYRRGSPLPPGGSSTAGGLHPGNPCMLLRRVARMACGWVVARIARGVVSALATPFRRATGSAGCNLLPVVSSQIPMGYRPTDPVNWLPPLTGRAKQPLSSLCSAHSQENFSTSFWAAASSKMLTDGCGRATSCVEDDVRRSLSVEASMRHWPQSS